ncbi:MAG: Mur ligase family protein [Capnocytophaga sp.]|nr:Mur ligase family protein [Capnocytophaga sp.]
MRIHFIAIGGAAMHNLALELAQLGHQVTGSDDAIFEPSRSRLAKEGLLPEVMGWHPEQITNDIEIIILGMHAKKNNPELLQAQKLGLTICSYPEFIYQQAKNKTRVVIGGSHGKTTITSMVLHVMRYCGVGVDYLVGAQLEGFDRMVRLSDTAEFMLIEGDEYLSSATDLRPKFHLYQPTVALLTGIAWDHINVFPTKEIYTEQFRIFVDTITKGGILIYNEEDENLREIVENSENPIRKIPYATPEYSVHNGQTYLLTDEGELPLEIFGKHNMNNLEGAKWVCQNMGVDEADFYEAIASFKGASRRLERLYESDNVLLFKDFAHSPSKVSATVTSVAEQYPERALWACLELHTFSSLDKKFMQEYHQTLDKATKAIVFVDEYALKTKAQANISAEEIRKAFGRDDLIVITDNEELKKFLFSQNLHKSVFLLMSSGNYGGLDLDDFVSEVKNKC